MLVVIVAVPAHGQSFSCGSFRTEIKRTASGTEWTIARGSEKSTESARLKSGPRFECIEGEVLVVEFTPAAGKSFIGLYFPDGSDIGYSGQIARRNNRLVLPIQARARMDSKYRAAFDYHCRLDMPGDPIAPASRADCISLK
ncbi:MAG: hypothetical protein KIS73_29310 [Enhydrobacter sp.]|nr:hypothetical protein [Enhydrobacter sp.]